MCGIIGGWIRNAGKSPNFHAGLAKLKHRGPDDLGLNRWPLNNGEVVFGHTRLSIIDLSSAAHQPMMSSDGRYAIVFNGEIYNYRELRLELEILGYHINSESDTEVLLAAWITWGVGCLQRLKGMFSFTVFDKYERTLNCVRDGFGIKPLFYKLDDSSFVFSSEIGAINALSIGTKRLDIQQAYNYLANGTYDNSSETFFQNVKSLPPGHILTLNLTRAIVPSIRRWWSPQISERSDLSFSDASEKLRAMFLDSVRLHLRSDVPVGAALSGGIDSSAIVCAMRYIEPDIPLHTFSFVAPGSDFDEEEWADVVNDHVGAIPHKVSITHAELASDIDDMIRAQGEPFGSTSIYAQYRVFKLSNEAGVTVTLDGQGADELLGGYSGFPGPLFHSYWDRGDYANMVKAMMAWSQWPGRSIGLGANALAGQIAPHWVRNFALKFSNLTPTPSWMNIGVMEDAGVMLGRSKKQARGNESEGRRLACALRGNLMGEGLQSLLRHGDRNSMRWSIESRVPFLTTEIAEFLLSLPEHYLVSKKGETKHIFRSAMRDIVPDRILDRKVKVGFSTPENVWLKQLGSKVDEWLRPIETLPFLDASKCKSEIKAIINGNKSFDFKAWRIINYCRWIEITGASI
jgi:asparagine synthase (glutamine-hydrolysing)